MIDSMLPAQAGQSSSPTHHAETARALADSRPRIERAARRWTSTREDAEDAASEGIVRAWKRHTQTATWKEPDGAERFAITTAKRAAQRTGVRATRFERDADVYGLDEARASDHSACLAPDALLVGNELCEIVISTVRAMPPVQREVVRLRLLENENPSTIARTLRISRAAVDSSYYRGMLALRKVLVQYLGEEAPRTSLHTRDESAAA